jgi:tetratricopeptide (TPR) repeat protein
MRNDKNLTVDQTFNLAVQNHKEGKTDIAQELYNQILKIDPNHSQALNNIAVIFTNLKDYQKAKECYEKAIELNPNYVDAHNNLGIIFQGLGENQKAKECFKKVIELNPNFANAHNNLGIIFQGLGENQKAKECCEKAIELNPNYADAHNNLGIIFQGLSEYQKAKECCEKAIEINPNDVAAYNNLGIIFTELREYQKAKKCYEKTIEINPNQVAAHNNLANILRELGENQKAKECCEKVIEINPNDIAAHNNLGNILKGLGEYKKAKECYEKAIEINPNHVAAHNNLSTLYTRNLDELEKSINLSYKALKIFHNNSKFINQSIRLFKLKHDVQQAQYLISKNYKIEGVNEFKKIGSEILEHKENKEDKNNSNQVILLNKNEIDSLLPFYKSEYVYKPKTISSSCINANKNWLDVEDEYLNSANQIMYIDDFLSDEALIELYEFCLVSKVWNTEYQHKYLGAFSNNGFISPIHLQIALDLQQKLPKIFGPYKLEKFWGFKYDSILGKGINIHADFAIHNLNFWITPDEFNNNKNTGGLKVYDAPAPDNWTFKDYNNNDNKIYQFLKENNANCTTVPYKFNRAVLFNSAYFHETDEIDFKDNYEGRRINNTYLFGSRLVK